MVISGADAEKATAVVIVEKESVSVSEFLQRKAAVVGAAAGGEVAFAAIDKERSGIAAEVVEIEIVAEEVVE